MIDLKEMFFEDILTYVTAVSITGDFYQKAIELANWFFNSDEMQYSVILEDFYLE